MIIIDFELALIEDGTLTISIAPPVPIGGWPIGFIMTNRFGGISGLIQKYVASGYNGQSGITITNSGLGIFNVALFANDVSGKMLNPGCYAFQVIRTDVGFQTILVQGYRECIM